MKTLKTLRSRKTVKTSLGLGLEPEKTEDFQDILGPEFREDPGDAEEL